MILSPRNHPKQEMMAGNMMGSVLNGANLTGFWDFRERLAPADAGDGFED